MPSACISFAVAKERYWSSDKFPGKTSASGDSFWHVNNGDAGCATILFSNAKMGDVGYQAAVYYAATAGWPSGLPSLA